MPDRKCFIPFYTKFGGGSASGTKYHISLDLLFSHGHWITVTIPDDALETINWSDVNFQCVINTRNRRAKSFLVTYIRLQYCKYCDCTAVIDDLHTSESISIRRNNEITAEEIIRRISDDTGRGIKDGKSLVQRSFNGNVIFVGEYMIGKGSTVPRELIANITQPIDGRILYKYQNNKKLIVSTFYRYFIQWYVNNYTELCSFIGRKLNEHRQKEPIYGLHARLNDTAFYLITSYQIFIIAIPQITAQ